MRFDASNADFQFVEKANWLATGITYHMGVDGISLPLVILTTAIMPFCIIASWKAITNRVREYMMAFLILETLMIGTFSALDLVLFYLFFEGGLIPMFLIIGVWGGPRRVYASFKFFLYTLLGSVLMLLAIMALYWNGGTTDIPTLMHTAVPRSLQTWAWLAFFASFAVKMPMWPVHTWLPDAHVEAPTAGSVVLAAILLKMGGYGFLRFSLPMFPLASHDFAPFVFTLSAIAIIYTSLVALMQEDMKKLIAYSSVAHMGFVTMGIFAGTMQGVAGGVFQMISHGIVSGALFPLRRHRLRPHAYPRHRGLWRPRQPDAALRADLHGLHHGQCRSARHFRLRRRVHDAARHLQGLDPDRVLRHLRRDPVGLLRALALPQGGVRSAGQAVADEHEGSHLPGVPDAVPADRADDPVRHLPEAGARHVGGLGPATRQQLQHRCDGREGRRTAPVSGQVRISP
ncbi:hypothetical protein ACVWW3_002772 [Bradyrhizobium sp. LM2.9]